jgi:hypothetical protein
VKLFSTNRFVGLKDASQKFDMRILEVWQVVYKSRGLVSRSLDFTKTYLAEINPNLANQPDVCHIFN